MGKSNEAGVDEARTAADLTIYAAVEVSRKSWTVALHAPNADRIGLHTIPAADIGALAGLMDRARDTLERERGPRPRVLCGYEAGYEGFWLARRLARLGVETLVLDPASLPASRRAKRVKTDRLDAARMLRALMTFDRGEPRVLSPVRVPSVEEEDRRRLLRERRRLVKQRTMLTNSVKGLLMLHGVFDLDPRTRDFAERLDAAHTGYGTPLPPGLRAEVRRTATLLEVVEGQIAEIEAERDGIVARAVVERATSGTALRDDGGKRAESGATPEDDGKSGAMIARLVGLRGVGANDAVLLVREVFCRGFRNRRELAGWAGLTPAPWASGGMARSQGIDKAGPPWLRAQMFQLAWRWLRHQPESALSKWFRARAGASGGRVRRVFVIALARKLLVALWRYATNGVVPDGVALA